jgi:thymidylate synthase (FAD)
MYAKLMNAMGDDLTVVNAARVSFAKEVEEFGQRDTRLIKYLARHNHWTPFAHVTATFRVQAPIFVARQLFKHVVGLVANEVSRRYVDDAPKFFAPEEWRGRPTNAKQGSDGVVADDNRVNHAYADALSMCIAAYDTMLDAGVAPEQARMVLPQSMMTEWIWTGSLAAFARVCKQRISKDAQAETAVIAKDISDQLSGVAPVSWEVLTDGGE